LISEKPLVEKSRAFGCQLVRQFHHRFYQLRLRHHCIEQSQTFRFGGSDVSRLIWAQIKFLEIFLFSKNN